MAVTYKAFVSSTYEDLKAHRAFVIESLRKSGFFVDPMEDWTAEPDEPRRFSTDRLEGCNLCVLLVAFRRGFIPSGEIRSITQLEYQAAIDRGIDVLTFLLDEKSAWPRHFDELDDSLKGWRTELMTRHGVSTFSLDPKTIEIQQALTRWVFRQKSNSTEIGSDWVQLVSKVLRLPSNEPETWTVAKQLLPHALSAVEREYYQHLKGNVAPSHAIETEPLVNSAPIRTLLAETSDFLRGSQSKFERVCYVIIPFGRKNLFDGTTVDFDEIYEKIFAPAVAAVRLGDGSAALEPVRSDYSGDIQKEMFEYLEYSRVVLADISAFSANIFYELGHRHRARATGTVIVRQEHAVIPFDISTIPTFRYQYQSAEDAAESRELIRRVLEDALQRNWRGSPSPFASEPEKR